MDFSWQVPPVPKFLVNTASKEAVVAEFAKMSKYIRDLWFADYHGDAHVQRRENTKKVLPYLRLLDYFITKDVWPDENC